MISERTTIFLRLFFYILLISFTFSQLFFFGTLMMIPLDLMFFAEKNANVWGFLVAFLVGSLTLYFLYKEKTSKNKTFRNISRRFSLGIGLLLNIVFSGTVLIFFISFSRFNHEPWLISGGWFLREQGIIWSIFIGTAVFSGILAIDELLLLKKIFDAPISLKIGRAKWNFTIGGITSIFSLALTFLLSGILLSLYRLTTLYGTFLFTFGLAICISILFIASKGIEFPFHISIYLQETVQSSLPEVSIHEKRKNRRISTLFLIIAISSLIIMILYFFNITFIIPYPPGVNANRFILPIQQLLTIVLGTCIGLVTIGGFSHFIFRNSAFYEINPTKNEFINKIVRILFEIAIFITISFILAILGLGLYLFEFVLYLPQVLTRTFIWVIIGILIFLLVERIELSPKLRYILSYTVTIVAFVLLITNFWAISLDLIDNSSSQTSGYFDIYFPFEYLFSIKNITIVGLCMGYLLSSVLKSVIFGLKKTDSSMHGNSLSLFFLILAPLAVGCLIGFSSMVIDLRGGDPTQALYSSDVVIPLLRTGLVIPFILSLFRFNIIAARNDVRTPEKKSESHPSLKKIISTKILPDHSSRVQLGSRLKVSVIISVVVLSTLSGGLGTLIGFTASKAWSMPLVASTSTYDIWVGNSSERFNHQTRISTVSSPQIEYVTFKMGKNEYFAFQLGLTLKSQNTFFHSYYLTEFTCKENTSEIVSSNSAQLRYEDYILDEEFPDKLIPIEDPIFLAKRQTHMFWFDIRTPYKISSGTYEGFLTIVFKMGNQYLEENIRIRFFIWDYAIPYQKHLRTNVGDSPISTHLYNDLVENWLKHRFNMYGEDIQGTSNYRKFEIYNGEQYIYYLNKTSGEVIFNWTLWDNKIESLLEATNAPMNGIRIDYPLGRSLKIRNETENQWFLNWLVKVEQHLELKGWLNICYYYFVDEFSLFIPDGFTRADYYETVKDQLISMKTAAPKIRIMAVVPPLPDLESIKPYIDIYCPISYDRDMELWEITKEGGKEMWFYTCVGPYAPYPNVHLYNRLFETRLQMWNAWAWNMDGYLFWRANSYEHGTYGFGYNAYGDGWFIYMDENRIYDSIRWENLGDGQEDYEMFWLLNASLNEIERQSLMTQSEIDSYRRELSTIVDTVADNFLEYTNNPHDLYKGRERIGEILHTLSFVIDIVTLGEIPWYPISGIYP